MKICLYSPYVPKHCGGGEKYFFDVARILAEKHEVAIAITSSLDEEQPQVELRRRYEDFISNSLEKVFFVSSPLGSQASFFEKILWTKQFDALYYITDGSFFFSLAKRNIVHIQIPLPPSRVSLLDRLKFLNWGIKNTNSEFTKKVIEKNWPFQVQYVHQPILPPSQKISFEKKEKIILHVGRFFSHLHTKRQDILVEIFRLLLKKYSTETLGWKLVLVGSVEDEDYAQKVAFLAQGFPIEIFHSVTRSELNTLYSRSAVYWHATGYGIDEEREPEKVEHFGISTGEAMAYGCVPVVLGKGGQPEVLGPMLKHLLWQTQEECIEKTATLIKNKELREKNGVLAQEQVLEFSEKRFRTTLSQMVQE